MATRTVVADGVLKNWSTAASWVGGVLPTAADDVVVPSNAILNVNTSVGTVCRSMTVQNGGTLRWAATASFAIGDASGGALTIEPSATVTIDTGITATVNFVSTSDNGGVGWPITTNGRTLGNVTFNGVGGKWTLQDALTCGVFTLTAGHFDTNSQNVTSTLLTLNGTPVKVLTLGASVWTTTGNNTGVSISGSNITLNAGTSTVNVVAVVNINTFGVGLVWNNVVLNGAGSPMVRDLICQNLTRTGTAAATDGFGIHITSVTVLGTLTVTGDSPANRVLVYSTTLGTPAAITANAVSLTDVDFMDITGEGAATWSGTRLGDCLGNSGITFQTSRTLYAVAPGNFSDSAMWSLTSGGTTGEDPPLPQDDVVLDAASAAGVYSINVIRPFRNIDCTGFTRTLGTAGGTITVYGSWTLSSDMVFSPGNPNWVFAGRGSHTITSAGQAFTSSGGNRGVNINAPGGTYTLGDALTTGTSSGVSFFVSAGTFATANYPITLGREFESAGTAARTLNLGTSTITMMSAPHGPSFSGSNLTINAADAAFVLATAGTSTRTFAGGGQTYGTITYTVADSPGALVITGANTIGTLNIGPGRQVTFPSNTITTVGDLNLNGSKASGFYMPTTAQGSVAASAARPPGDFTFDIHFAQDNWTPGTDQSHVGLWVAGRLSWMFSTRGNSGGIPMIALSIDGTASASIFANGSPTVSYVNGQATWLRAAVDIDNGSSQRSVRFYQSPDGVTWTQLGTTRTAATAGACFNTADPMVLNISPATGIRYHRVKLYDTDLGGAAGTPTVDLDLNDKPFLRDYASESLSGAPMTFTGANFLLGDGRTLVRSSTTGTPATLQITGAVDQHSGVDVQDITFNGTDAFLGAQAAIRTNVRGVKRSPQRVGMMV